MKKTAILIVLFIAAVFLPGCTSHTAAGQDIARDTIRAHYEHHGDWSPGFGCFEKITGYAYNTGNITVDTVVLNYNLVDTQSGTIRDSRSVFIGTMEAGQSRTFETDLEGECIPAYRVDATIVP
ncbi:MAG: FxLYD domain-containing protein [Methanoregula sp.]|nr:FxLYD domain-containing protein [Methanoregula sp.]